MIYNRSPTFVLCAYISLDRYKMNFHTFIAYATFSKVISLLFKFRNIERRNELEMEILSKQFKLIHHPRAQFEVEAPKATDNQENQTGM